MQLLTKSTHFQQDGGDNPIPKPNQDDDPEFGNGLERGAL